MKPPAGKKLYFELKEGKLDLTENSKNRANLREVAKFINQEMPKALESASLNPDSLEQLKKVEAFYNTCETARVQKATGSFWSWLIRLFKPRDYFVEQTLHHDFSKKEQQLHARQADAGTRERVGKLASSVQSLVVGSQLFKRAAALGIEAPKLRAKLREGVERDVLHASPAELTRLEAELMEASKAAHAAVGALQAKEKAFHGRIQMAATTSAHIREAAAALDKSAHDKVEALVDLEKRAALHLEAAPLFQELHEAIQPLLQQAKALQLRADPALAPAINQVTAALIRLSVQPGELTADEVAKRVGQKEQLEAELASLQSKNDTAIQKREQLFEEKKKACFESLKKIQAMRADLDSPLPVIDERLQKVENRLKEKAEIFDDTISEELAAIEQEIAKRVLSLPKLRQFLLYYSHAKQVDETLPRSTALALWQESGTVEDLELLKTIHRASILPKLFQKSSVSELRDLLKSAWIHDVGAEREVQQELQRRTEAHFQETIAHALQKLQDKELYDDVTTTLKAECAGLPFEQAVAFGQACEKRIAEVNQLVDERKKLRVAAENYAELLPLLHEIQPDLRLAVAVSPQELRQEIHALQKAIGDVQSELQKNQWKAIAKGGELTVADAKAHIQKKNQEQQKLQQFQAQWQETKEALLREIEGLKARHTGQDIKNKLARELLGDEESAIKEATLPLDLSLNLEKKIGAFQARLTTFKQKLEAEFRIYSETNRGFKRLEAEGAALLKKRDELQQVSKLLMMEAPLDIELPHLPQAELSIRKKIAVMQELAPKLEAKLATLQEVVKKRTAAVTEELKNRTKTLQDGLTACKRACKNKPFRDAIAPLTLAKNASLVEQAKATVQLAGQLKEAEKIQLQDAKATRLLDEKIRLAAAVAPLLQEAKRLSECLQKSHLANRVPEIELQAFEDLLTNLPTLTPGATFDAEYEKHTAHLKKIKESLPELQTECEKAKKAFDEHAEKQLATIREEVNKTTELLRRIETKKEGFEVRLTQLRSRVSSARGANWAEELDKLAEESRSLNSALTKIIQASEAALRAQKMALGPVEKMILQSLHLTEAALENQAVLKVTLEAARPPKIAHALLDHELKQTPINARRALACLFEMQALAEKNKLITEIIDLRSALLQRKAVSAKEEESIQGFFGTNLAGLKTHILDPNTALQIKPERIAAFMKRMKDEL